MRVQTLVRYCTDTRNMCLLTTFHMEIVTQQITNTNAQSSICLFA